MLDKILSVIGVFLANVAIGQSGAPFAVWENQTSGSYEFVQLDASTGNMNSINVIPGMNAFVAGNKSAFNTDANIYHFSGLANGSERFYSLDASTGNVISDPLMSSNVVGIEYNCNDSMLYGIREAANVYDFVNIDATTATVTSLGPVPGINGYVSNSFSIDLINNWYVFAALENGAFRMKVLDCANGMIVFDHLFPDNLTGYRYSCADSGLYALWENAGQYRLESVDPVTGSHSMVNVLAGVTPGIIPESSSMDQIGIYTYRGFDATNAFALISIDVSNGNVTSVSQTQDNATGFEEGVCCLDTAVAVGLSHPDINTHVTVFPNPVLQELNVILPEFISQEDALISIYNMKGQLVLSETISKKNDLQMDVSRIGKGTYIGEIKTRDSGVFRFRFSKE